MIAFANSESNIVNEDTLKTYPVGMNAGFINGQIAKFWGNKYRWVGYDIAAYWNKNLMAPKDIVAVVSEWENYPYIIVERKLLNKEYEAKFLIPSNFLERHSLTPEAREKMVDWMVEVFSVNKSEQGTLQLAVHIMDAYILNTKRMLKDGDIHLIGLCSIYLASKIEEKIPLRLTHIVNNLGKNTFSKDEIIEMERDIVKTIEFDFFTAGSYDYLMVFFYDLKVNNSAIIQPAAKISILES